MAREKIQIARIKGVIRACEDSLKEEDNDDKRAYMQMIAYHRISNILDEREDDDVT